MGNKGSQGAMQGAMQGGPNGAVQGASQGAQMRAPPPDMSQYTYANRAQLSAKIRNGSFNPETDFALMTVDNTNPKIGKTYGTLPDNVEKLLEDRIFQLFPNEIYRGGVRKRRRKTRKAKGKRSRKHNKK